MAEHEGSSAAEKLTYLLIGAGIGATVALLFAPKSGRELRGDIADYTRRGIDAASEGARAVGTKASEIYGAASDRVAGAYGTVREKVSRGAGAVSEAASRQKESIAAAIEAGKQAYREEKRKAGEAGYGAAVEGEETL
ncbi:MAG TPA: YtxH domain-containing protein [Blastocatellia bacterium]|nr:YtxH domain-containing protein [Blastocatellia bacterium]